MNLKQTLIRVGLLFVVGFAFASEANQAGEKKNDTAESSLLTTTLKPALSNGFTTWEGYNNPDITYEIEVISGKSVVETISTKKNYYKFDMVTYQNHDFRIKAIDSISSEVVGVGPQDHASLQIPGAVNMKSACKKICNGKNYSFSMDLMQEDTPNWAITDAGHLMLGSVYTTFDFTVGAANLNWEPVSPVVYDLNEQYYLTNNHEVQQVILPSPVSASATHYYDASNNLMSGLTYFVQKKMRQFAYAVGNRSTTFNPNSTICGAGLNFWMERLNNYPHPDNQIPSAADDEATLYCHSAITPTGTTGSGTGGPGQSGNGSATSAYWTDNVNADTNYLCSATGGTWFYSSVPCEDTYLGGGNVNWGNGTGGGYSNQTAWIDPKLVDRIVFKPLSDKGHNVVLGEGGDFLDTKLDPYSLKSGIYQRTIFMKDGRGFPRYMEIVNNISAREFRR